ncbi:hypothetical protein, partial [Neisseria gonorrhoeae]|uniref:hypothetical protein n=1 Tax=Neisseria gonorrhoeae TaxID=485 RepID=UPI002163FB63
RNISPPSSFPFEKTARSIHRFAVPLPRFEVLYFIALCYPRLGRYSFRAVCYLQNNHCLIF